MENQNSSSTNNEQVPVENPDVQTTDVVAITTLILRMLKLINLKLETFQILIKINSLKVLRSTYNIFRKLKNAYVLKF